MRKDLFCAIDLHSNNNYVEVIDAEDRRLFEKRLKNDLLPLIAALDIQALDTVVQWVTPTFRGRSTCGEEGRRYCLLSGSASQGRKVAFPWGIARALMVGSCGPR